MSFFVAGSIAPVAAFLLALGERKTRALRGYRIQPLIMTIPNAGLLSPRFRARRTLGIESQADRQCRLGYHIIEDMFLRREC